MTDAEDLIAALVRPTLEHAIRACGLTQHPGSEPDEARWSTPLFFTYVDGLELVMVPGGMNVLLDGRTVTTGEGEALLAYLKSAYLDGDVRMHAAGESPAFVPDLLLRIERGIANEVAERFPGTM